MKPKKAKKRAKRKSTSKAIWWWKFILARARQVTKWSPEHRKCLQEAKGFCAGCKTGGHEDLADDHIDPVVPVDSPFAGDWNKYFDRLFNGKRQALCSSCHDKKTEIENKLRKQFRDAKKFDLNKDHSSQELQ